MKERARAYRFRTAAQWARCIGEGFDVAKSAALQPIARLGTAARPFTKTGRVTLVEADRFGGPIWRLDADGRISLVRTELDEVSRPFEVDQRLAACPRWLLDRDWIWAFDLDAPIVRRYGRDTVDEDLVIDLRDLTITAADVDLAAVHVRDLAGDGREGVWLLLEGADGRWWVLHLDCRGQPQEIDLYSIRCDLERPVQLGMVSGGQRLVLLTRDNRLTFLNAANGTVLRVVTAWRDDPCWRVERMATDGSNRIALLCRQCDEPTRWAVFILDAQGDSIDLVTGPQQMLTLLPNDVAIAQGVLWLAADNGLWQLDSSDASIARESDSVLLTPALVSPRTGAGGGWLRAEIDVDLPRGAVIEAEAVTTDDKDRVDQAIQIAGDLSLTAAQRQEAVWNLFDHSRSRVFYLTAAPAKGQPVAVPLFDTQRLQTSAAPLQRSATDDPWLWLRLKLVTPPGVAPPEIRELRVLYPDASIVQHTPAIFRGRDNDPTGFFRSLVGVLETTTQGIDDKIRSIGAHIDPDSAPVEWLDYVARWLDLPWEDALPGDAKRRIVKSAGPLLEQRGTRRGLQQLLGALVGPAARVRIVDLTVDHPPMRLGGSACGGGARLPMLLAGAPPTAPILGTRTILGRACLGPGVSSDPLRTVGPALQIAIAAPRADQQTLAPLVARVLAQYVPVGIKVTVRWTPISAWLAGIDPTDDEGELLDANGPGRLGEDSEIGRIVLSGRGARRVDAAGLDVGFRLS